jgi:Flp pilus assembly protein TadD
MSRTPLALATILALTFPVAVAAQETPAPAAPRAQPADAATRATYERMDPLARSVFWAREQEINPADPVAGARVAQALRELGQYQQAVAAAEKTLTVQPDNVEALLELGRAHIARGQAFYGVQPLERARTLAPRDWRPLSLLGVAYQQVKRVDEARAAWSEALRLSPENPDVLTNAAIALMADGNAAGAETLLRRAAVQPTATLKVRQNLALALGLQGKTAEAEAILRRDLPPEAADRNLDWLRRRVEGQAAATAAAPSSGRTWDTLGG